MTQNGRFIKLWGSIKDWEWADDLEMVGFWVHLLMEANWQDKQWRGIIVKRGQLIFGRREWAKKLNVSEQRLRTIIARLKSTSEITIQSTNKYSILTIVKYEKYQSQENKSTSKTTSKTSNEQPAINQQSTTPLERVEGVEGVDSLPPIIPQGGSESEGESEPKREKTQRVKKEPEAPLDIPHFIPEDLLLDFFANRKAIKKPMTHRAKELFLNKIIALYHQGHDPTKLLATAIERGWQTVYESNDTLSRGNHENTQRLNPKHPKQAYDNRSAWERQRDKNLESIARLQAEVDAEDIAMGKTPSPRTEEGFGRFW
jgi:hypothetical protein